MALEILLVDDNPIQAQARGAILARTGLPVRITGSGSEALAVLGNPEAREAIGLMVTDHLMPGMNGPELVEHVVQLAPDLPILVLSGLADAESEYDAERIVFRLKPFPPHELIRLAQHMLGEQALRTA
ncbi:response regulator [Acidipila sp. EB88]|uniref:response regulator n=1 Tax=Acidipila sp. EB88 TaxID=2305226 RepID=UPI000F5EACA7|nr:response regulator [Acidipila sp. EB88]RRA47366.1 response regulator [Acidipila sp. EB88]